ncbi:Uncharacterised protein [Vibrio cholerae]|nr:Uncharacterised protein [Vibrio cholerae]
MQNAACRQVFTHLGSADQQFQHVEYGVSGQHAKHHNPQ